MKTVVITGTSQGLGLILARNFIENGWNVIGTGRSEKPTDFPAEAQYVQFDASDSNACHQFWGELSKENTEICLVNNAGGYIGGSFLDLKPGDFHSQMNSIYFSAVHMTQGLMKKIAHATIINVISNSALQPNSGDSAYGSAKAAEAYFFKSLQKEFTSSEYKITNLYPTSIASHGPNSKAIDADELAALILQLAENNASYYFSDVTIHPAA